MLFTPKDWWHHHEEHVACTENHAEVSIHVLADDCFVCDFVLQPAIGPLSLNVKFPSQVPSLIYQQAIGYTYCSEFPPLTLRGPPSDFNS